MIIIISIFLLLFLDFLPKFLQRSSIQEADLPQTLSGSHLLDALRRVHVEFDQGQQGSRLLVAVAIVIVIVDIIAVFLLSIIMLFALQLLDDQVVFLDEHHFRVEGSVRVNILLLFKNALIILLLSLLREEQLQVGEAVLRLF